MEEILNEISALANKRTKKIILLGRNVNNFKGTFKGKKNLLG
jgi:2-methylthioadenine synthetase